MESRTLDMTVRCSETEGAPAVCDSVEVHSPMPFSQGPRGMRVAFLDEETY